MEYLREDESFHEAAIGEDLRKMVSEWIPRKFYEMRHSLWHCYFNKKRTFGNYNSSVAEAENWVLKTCEGGPRGNQSLDRSFRATESQSTSRRRIEERKQMAAFESVPTNKEERERTVLELMRYCNLLLHDQYDMAQYYVIIATDDPNVFLVKRRYKRPVGTASKEKRNASHKSRLRERTKWIVPDFERTRTIRISVIDGMRVATCDCNHHAEHGLCCRHIYKLVGRAPIATDAVVRWWSKYTFYMSRDHLRIGQILMKHRDIDSLSGVPLCVPCLPIIEARATMPFSYFTRSLHRLYLRPSYWTNQRREIAEQLYVKPGTASWQVRQSRPNMLTFFHHSQEARADMESQDTAGIPSDGESTSDEDSNNGCGKEDPYHVMTQRVGQMARYCKTHDWKEIVEKHMASLEVALMKRCAEESGVKQTSENTDAKGMLSFPEDTKKPANATRKRKMGEAKSRSKSYKRAQATKQKKQNK